ncbi:SAM-dependent methyltransferase [Actinoplanes sp. NPDC051851]|uniref:SAM-dependent methyltransferase n=1 Tax=Actinoplanes sp. NPDC051851 TaxID=3154753 RepID=UPI003449CB4F
MAEDALAGLDTNTVHPARRYNYWLGGKDNFAADRASGDLIERAHPTVRVSARENRAFLQRAVHHLATGASIGQFLDIGTGLPTADNTHQVAQRANPAARVVYVDNDPMVMTHARALLSDAGRGATCYIEEDLRNPGKILAHPHLRETLDLSQPVALTLVAVLHFLRDHTQAREIVAELLDALAPGSFLVLSHATLDYATPQEAAFAWQMVEKGMSDAFPRTHAQVAEYLTGLAPVDPGIVPVSEWHPRTPPAERPTPHDVAILGAVARKL